MSEGNPPSRGPGAGGESRRVNVDQALAAWPDRLDDAAAWDALGDRIEARLRTNEPGNSAATLSDDALFAAPLPQTPEDGRQRDRKSFQDLAKLAALTPTPPPSSASTPASWPRASTPDASTSTPERKDDSGIVDLREVAAIDPEGAARAKSTPLATESLFEDDG